MRKQIDLNAIINDLLLMSIELGEVENVGLNPVFVDAARRSIVDTIDAVNSLAVSINIRKTKDV